MTEPRIETRLVHHVDVESHQEVRRARPPATPAGTVSNGGSTEASSEHRADLAALFDSPVVSGLMAQIGGGALTPETILAMVRRHVDQHDSQVQSLVAGIEQRTLDARAVQEQLEIVQAVMAAATSDGSERTIGREVPVSVPGRTEPRTAAEWLESIGATAALGDGDGKIRVSSLESTRDGLRAQLGRINSGNEMDMLTLQNVMQQRSQIIQIGTNVMHSMHESAQGAIRNIG